MLYFLDVDLMEERLLSYLQRLQHLQQYQIQAFQYRASTVDSDTAPNLTLTEYA